MVKKIVYILSCLFALLLINTQIFAQEIKVKAPSEYVVGKPFKIIYILSTDKAIEVKGQPDFSGLELLYGPAIGRSHSTTIINGTVSSSSQSELTYTLLANKEGRYKVSGLRLSLDDKELIAPAVFIQIKGESLAPSHSSREGIRRSVEERAEYKYQAIVPRKSVYVQEALPIVYKLQSTEHPRLSGDIKPSVYEGFVSLDLLKDAPRNLQVERIGQRDWVTVDLMKELLFAQHPGQLLIPSNELSVLYTLRDPSGDPFLNQTFPKRLSTDPITIEVKPLPEEGKPEVFSGAVGKFSARYECETDVWKTNEAVNLKLILEGQGNLKIVSLPKISLPNDIEVYDPIERNEQHYDNGSLRSFRQIEYNLIPRNTGKITIPSVSLSFFNPSTERYEKASTEAIEIQIVQGRILDEATTIVNSTAGVSADKPYPLCRDLDTKELYNPQILNFILLHLLVVSLTFVGYYFLSRHKSLRASTIDFAYIKASKVANKRLKLAYTHLQSSDKEAFLDELPRALWGYLGDKLRLPTSQLTRDNISGYLSSWGLSEEETRNLLDLLDGIEFVRFAPNGVGEDIAQLYDKSVHFIRTIEALKRTK